jgi:hypothetical protein
LGVGCCVEGVFELKCNTLDEEDEGVGPSCRMFIRDGLEID